MDSVKRRLNAFYGTFDLFVEKRKARYDLAAWRVTRASRNNLRGTARPAKKNLFARRGFFFLEAGTPCRAKPYTTTTVRPAHGGEK